MLRGLNSPNRSAMNHGLDYFRYGSKALGFPRQGPGRSRSSRPSHAMTVGWRPAARIHALRPIPSLWRTRKFTIESDGFEPLSCPVATACRGVSTASFGRDRLAEGLSAGGLQELWQKFFSDPTQWWDNRRSKENPRHPDFKHKKSKAALWLNNSSKPAWVESQLARLDTQMDAGIGRRSVTALGQAACSRLAAYKDDLEVTTCRKLCEDGQLTEAVDALNLLVQRGCRLHNNIFYCALKRCIAQKELGLGRRIHALSVQSGYKGDAFLATHLIGLYASHGRLEEAMRVFSEVPIPDSYMWASIISANARLEQPKQAIRLYRQMRKSAVKPDNRIFVGVLKACASAGDLGAGKDVHAHLLASKQKPDMFVQNSLIHMYAKCGSLKDAQQVFDRLAQKDVVTWNAMIAGYSQQGMGQESLRLYKAMQQEGITHPNTITFVCLLQACASAAALSLGKQLHTQIEEQELQGNVVVNNSLVNMYAKCGSLEDAQRVFDRLSEKDVVTWTAMIAGYAQQGMGHEALSMYSSMRHEGITLPDSVAFICLLQACAIVGVAALQQGKQLHAQIKERGMEADVVVGNSLVSMYAKCGGLEDARREFDRLPHRDVVTWNAMIAGYSQQGRGQEALTLYNKMQQEGITLPDSVTFVSLLQACASVTALPLGKQLHAQIEELKLLDNLVLGPSLVNMYAKCGSLEDAQRAFDSLPERNIEAWRALIGGYARHGDSNKVFDMVDQMTQHGIEPDAIILLSVLTVCDHMGLVDKGRYYFVAMSTDYGIKPSIEHYNCMVDLLGRAGLLDEALEMVKTMPVQPDGTMWRTLLAACQKWVNVEVGLQAFEFAVRLDKKDAAAYVLMSNIYEAAQMWEEANQMQARRVKSGVRKQAGQSWWTDVDGVVHSFVVGERKISAIAV